MNNKFFNKKWILSLLLIISIFYETHSNSIIEKQMGHKEVIREIKYIFY